MRYLCASFILIVFVTGCIRLPPSGENEVISIVEERIDTQTEWVHGNYCDQQTDEMIQYLVNSELTADSAIQIALLNNPKIQVFFEDLGMAQADLIEAGLLSNPSFDIEIRYPQSKGLKTNIEYLITSSLLDIFLIPLRTRLSSTEFEQTKLKVSNEILNLAFEVRETFYELIGQIKTLKYLESKVGLAEIIGEISAKQIAIRNVTTLEFQLSQAKFLEAELEYARSQAEVIRLKEKLNRLLGFTEDFCLILPENLPETDYKGLDLCLLESIALEDRLDLQVARLEIARISQMLGLKNWWAYTLLKGGLAGEREPDGANVIGPGFTGELPIFNYGQAARLRLSAELRQAQDQLAELEIKILSEVREAHKLLMIYLKIIQDYRTKLLPMQNKISNSSEELYNVMGLGIDKLLDNKRLRVLAEQNYTEILKKYLLARVQLDRALGGYLSKLLIQKCEEESFP